MPQGAREMIVVMPDSKTVHNGSMYSSSVLLQVLADQRERSTARGGEGAQGVAATHMQRLSEQRTNLRALEGAIVPRQVDLESAARSEACDSACRPRCGQSRQQADLSLVALQQHLGDCRRAAEVAVDLKRRMRIEHIGVSASGPSRNVSIS